MAVKSSTGYKNQTKMTYPEKLDIIFAKHGIKKEAYAEILKLIKDAYIKGSNTAHELLTKYSK